MYDLGMCTFSDGVQEFEESYTAALEKYGQQVAQPKDPVLPHSFQASDSKGVTEPRHGRGEKEMEKKEIATSHLTESEEYLLAEALDYEVVEASLDPLEAIAVSCPVSRA